MAPGYPCGGPYWDGPGPGPDPLEREGTGGTGGAWGARPYWGTSIRPARRKAAWKMRWRVFFWMFFPYSAFCLKQIWRNCVFVYFSPFDYASFLFNISVFQIEHLWASNIKFLSGTLRQDLGRLARSWQCFQQISNRWGPTSRLNTTRIVNQLILSSTLSLQLLFALFNVEQSICSTWSRCISFTNSEVYHIHMKMIQTWCMHKENSNRLSCCTLQNGVAHWYVKP